MIVWKDENKQKEAKDGPFLGLVPMVVKVQAVYTI